MEYLFAVVIFFVVTMMTRNLAWMFGILLPIIYSFLGFVFGVNSLIIGISGILANLLSILVSGDYSKIAVKGVRRVYVLSKFASIGYIFAFIIAISVKYILNYHLNSIEYLYAIIIISACFLLIKFVVMNRELGRVEHFFGDVIKCKIVEKYEEDPKWAVYLYRKNGEEGWSQTIPGSFCAKHPENDLTYVYHTKDEAMRYVKDKFTYAEIIFD